MFDLDDIFYDNCLVIDWMMYELLVFVCSYYFLFSQFDVYEFNQLCQMLLVVEFEIYYDVIVWCYCVLELGMCNVGFFVEVVKVGVDVVMEYFVYWCSCVDVLQEMYDMLVKLVKKWLLVVIINGNVCLELFGLSDYFCFVLCVGLDGCFKLFVDMYYFVVECLNVLFGQILYVGDDLIIDVVGVICCGMQVCWIKL